MNQAADNVVEYDIRGQICPSCLLMALNEVNQNQEQIKSGQVMLKIITDNRQATTTVPDAVRNMGYDVVVTKLSGHYEMVIAARSMGQLMN